MLFGQGLSVNAVQAAAVYATIANDGVRVPPRLVAGTLGADGDVTKTAAASTDVRVVSAGGGQRAADDARGRREQRRHRARGQDPRLPGRRQDRHGAALRPDAAAATAATPASFIGMAPADDPRLVVAVTLQRPVHGHFGGTVAAPVFQQVMTFALPSWRSRRPARSRPGSGSTRSDRYRLAARSACEPEGSLRACRPPAACARP